MPSDSNPLDVTITFPIFNEKTALRQCVLDMQEAMDRLPYSYEILLVDDGSSDGGLATVADLDVRTIRHIRNMGGAMARLTGIRYARGNIILQSDADGTYAVDAIGVMLEKINHCDLVIGARKRESATDWRWMRIITKWLMRKLAELLSSALCSFVSQRPFDHEYHDAGLSDERPCRGISSDRLLRSYREIEFSPHSRHLQLFNNNGSHCCFLSAFACDVAICHRFGRGGSLFHHPKSNRLRYSGPVTTIALDIIGPHYGTGCAGRSNGAIVSTDHLPGQ